MTTESPILPQPEGSPASGALAAPSPEGTAAAGLNLAGLNPAGTGPLAPWSLLPRAWLEPAGRRPGPWRPEQGLAPGPLTPYSAALWLDVLPAVTARISRDLVLPSAGVELRLDAEGRLLARPRPVGGWPGALAWRAARHGWTAGRQAAELVRWWDETGARAMLADAGELRLRIVPLERAGAAGDLKEWRRTLERCRAIWTDHLDRLLRLEALAALSLWQLDALLAAFRLPGAPRAEQLVPVPAVVAEIGQRLWHLAARGREVPAVAAAFAAPPYHPRLSRLAREVGHQAGTAGAADFFELWHQFLERYGYVALPAAELATPPWAEDPEPALAWLARFFHDRRLNPIAAEINAHRHQQELEGLIARHLARRPLDRGRIEETRRLAEATTRVAAEMGYHMLVLRSWWHRAVEGAGRALAARGRLDEPAQAWRYTPSELEAALDGGAGERGQPGGPGPSGGAGAGTGPSAEGRASPGAGSSGGTGRPAAHGPAGAPDPEALERARRRAHAFFRYAGMAYFVLIALIPVIMARQGLLWAGLREMALLLAELVVVLLPVAAVAGAVYVLRRAGRRRP
ncbi:hypothetical protein [Thermaerobacter litoralis]